MKQMTKEEFKDAMGTRIRIPVLAYFKERLEECKVALVIQTDEKQVRILQGRAQELNEIIQLIESVRE